MFDTGVIVNFFFTESLRDTVRTLQSRQLSFAHTQRCACGRYANVVQMCLVIQLFASQIGRMDYHFSDVLTARIGFHPVVCRREKNTHEKVAPFRRFQWWI
ncbi:unnamed protein product [Scytosiphon promiscuus]